MVTNNCKTLMAKTLSIATVGVGTLFLCLAPPIKGQEVNPTRFTETGIDDGYQNTRPQLDNAAKPAVANQPKLIVSGHKTARKAKTLRVSRKH
jgi:hypothetical protein